MSFPRCEFFESRQGQSDEEKRLAAIPRVAQRRGYYRFLDDASDCIRSYSLRGTDSMSSLPSLMSADVPRPLKVFFIGVPGVVGLNISVEEVLDRTTAICEGLGLEAVFFDRCAEAVPRILRSRATTILENKCEGLLRSCDVACVDLTCGLGASQLVPWQLGFLAALRTPVLAYGQTREDGSEGGGAPGDPSDADLCTELVSLPPDLGHQAGVPGAPHDALPDTELEARKAAHFQTLHDSLQRFLESLPPNLPSRSNA